VIHILIVYSLPTDMFFSATIGVSIALVTLLLSPSVPSVYQAILSVPNIALENAMACRVYRAVKLGVIKNPQSTVFELSARSHIIDEWNRELSFKQPTLDQSPNVQVNVDIMRTTDAEIIQQETSKLYPYDRV
jgi:hypothetical protein